MTAVAPGPRGPYRLILLDGSDPADPKWLSVLVESIVAAGPGDLNLVSPPLHWVRQQADDITATVVPLRSPLLAWEVEK